MDTQLILIIAGITLLVIGGGIGSVLLVRKKREQEAEEYLDKTIYSQELSDAPTSDIAQPTDDDTENVWVKDSAYTNKE